MWERSLKTGTRQMKLPNISYADQTLYDHRSVDLREASALSTVPEKTPDRDYGCAEVES